MNPAATDAACAAAWAAERREQSALFQAIVARPQLSLAEVTS